MKRDEMRNLLPIIQKWVNGETIECRRKGGKGYWSVEETPYFTSNYEYRIAPNSKTRPFKDGDECWKEMQKHQPFGWVISKTNSNFKLYIISVDDDGVMLGDYDEGSIFASYESLNKYYIFVDGSTCSIN